MVHAEQIIAARKVVAVEKATGTRTEVVIEIFITVPTEDGNDCFCRVQFTGIAGESYNIGGVDSLQALSLAIARAKARFEELRSETYDFLWPENEAPMDSLDYLPAGLA